MNLWLIIVLCVLSNGVTADSWAQKKVTELSESWDEKAFLKELEEMKDPFVSPLVKPKAAPVAVKPPEPPKVEVQPPVVKPPVVVEAKKPEPPKPRVILPRTVEPTFTFGGMQLNGVIWNTDLPQAIINDRIVSLGEDLNGAKITAITKDGLEVIHKGKKYILAIRTAEEAASDLTSGANKSALQRNPKVDMRRRVNER